MKYLDESSVWSITIPMSLEGMKEYTLSLSKNGKAIIKKDPKLKNYVYYIEKNVNERTDRKLGYMVMPDDVKKAYDTVMNMN